MQYLKLYYLYVCVGCVLHSLNNNRDIRDMGNLIAHIALTFDNKL